MGPTCQLLHTFFSFNDMWTPLLLRHHHPSLSCEPPPPCSLARPPSSRPPPLAPGRPRHVLIRAHLRLMLGHPRSPAPPPPPSLSCSSATSIAPLLLHRRRRHWSRRAARGWHGYAARPQSGGREAGMERGQQRGRLVPASRVRVRHVHRAWTSGGWQCGSLLP